MRNWEKLITGFILLVIFILFMVCLNYVNNVVNKKYGDRRTESTEIARPSRGD